MSTKDSQDDDEEVNKDDPMKMKEGFTKPKGGAKKNKTQHYLDVGMKYIKRVQKVKIKIIKRYTRRIYRTIDLKYPVKKVTTKQIWKCVKMVNKAIHSKVKMVYYIANFLNECLIKNLKILKVLLKHHKNIIYQRYIFKFNWRKN